MGRRRSERKDPEDGAVEEKPKAPPAPPGNAYWHVCVKCGKVLSGPHTSRAAITDAMIMPNVCEEGCDGEA